MINKCDEAKPMGCEDNDREWNEREPERGRVREREGEREKERERVRGGVCVKERLILPEWK